MAGWFRNRRQLVRWQQPRAPVLAEVRRENQVVTEVDQAVAVQVTVGILSRVAEVLRHFQEVAKVHGTVAVEISGHRIDRVQNRIAQTGSAGTVHVVHIHHAIPVAVQRLTEDGKIPGGVIRSDRALKVTEALPRQPTLIVADLLRLKGQAVAFGRQPDDFVGRIIDFGNGWLCIEDRHDRIGGGVRSRLQPKVARALSVVDILITAPCKTHVDAGAVHIKIVDARRLTRIVSVNNMRTRLEYREVVGIPVVIDLTLEVKITLPRIRAFVVPHLFGPKPTAADTFVRDPQDFGI